MATDPQVSRAKFTHEIALFQDQKEQYAKKGIWMLSVEYPDVLVAFATPKSQQVFVPFAALVNFTDYDARPLAVTLVHPCTRKALKLSEVLPQEIPNCQSQTPPRIARFRIVGNQLVPDSILQGYDNDDPKPFLCMPGVRSYHEHPAHTGDSWWLHKNLGEGSLHNILHTLWKYGASNITGQNLALRCGRSPRSASFWMMGAEFCLRQGRVGLRL
jgi:hypothetical protein